MFTFIRNCQAVFKMIILLTMYENPTCSTFSSVFGIITFYLLIFFLSLLIYMRLYLIMVLFCISLMTNVEHTAIFYRTVLFLVWCLFRFFFPFLLYWAMEIFSTFYIPVFYQINILQLLSLSIWLIFFFSSMS